MDDAGSAPSHSRSVSIPPAEAASRHLELALQRLVNHRAKSNRAAHTAKMIEQRQAATETAVSAPGKVLLAGGYLVLDRDYTGTVCALDARIHVVVQQQSVKRRPSAAETQTEGHAQLNSGQAAADGAVGAAEIPPATVSGGAQEEAVQDTVTVKSPQFVDAVWKYKIQRSDNGGGVRAVQCDDGF
ncbi:hypothetical protein H105_03717, partial [Trichophyton soudanense CBS 452.61]